MTGRFTILDWCVLLIYFTGVMGVGFYFHRKSRTSEEFTAGGRSLPGWVCGLSIFATYLSSISYLALPGKSYAANWNPFVFSLSIPIATWIAARWFLPYYRQGGEVSAYAMLERRFGTWARVYASVFYLLTQIARMGVVMYLMALPMAVIFDWDIRLIIMLTGLCVTLYAFIGGIVAVIWADAIQAIVLMVGAVICLIVLMCGVDGGAVEVVRTATETGKFSLGPVGPRVEGESLWFHMGGATILLVLLNGLVMNLQNFGIDQSYIQRYISSSSDREAKKSLWIGGVLYVPVSAVFFLIGTTLFVYYGQNENETQEVRLLVARQRLMQEDVPPVYEETEDGELQYEAGYGVLLNERASQLEAKDIGDRVFPHFIVTHLPPGLTGLLIAAVFAAAMSTVSTSLNSSSTLLMSDYYQRFINRDASERQRMFVLRGTTIIWGAIGTGMALLLVRMTESALDIWWTLSGVFGGGMIGLFLLGMISRRSKSFAAATGVVAALPILLWLSLPKMLQYLEYLEIPIQENNTFVFTLGGREISMRLSEFHPFIIPVMGTATILIVGLLLAAVAPKKTDGEEEE